MKSFVLLALVFIVSSACHHSGRHKTISVNEDNLSLRIEYAGYTVFNQDGTAIESITPRGYVRYRKNDTKFMAESDGYGELTYAFNDGRKKKYPNEKEKKFMTAAIKEMIYREEDNPKVFFVC